ncbi:hypothetical protein ELH24_21885 [Rhizobium ruizarguesonis]|uniref:hypothetical protein n=1 Tax=Rhizobium ruizarguesonis TaxID=2081791 RepID=UPI00102F7DFF|nr:hypothetical protein [Rhizobium ruizarguesonis]TBD01856.1 hypothetical protein ELH25_25605 [Rhizobium ruizarguesonis]TBD18002.1 hypothetical protein ELH24_21885 [Rhizobium ruizarguesonis]TBE99245.1 hypothetical protein ELG98_23000 [Rhizobium ruizarguesonis]
MKRLVADLERLNSGRVSAPDLMAEPVLNDWLHGVRMVSCLEGTVEGHPEHSDEHEIRTGELFAVFQEDGEVFVRTLDGWYRLGSERKAAEQ